MYRKNKIQILSTIKNAINQVLAKFRKKTIASTDICTTADAKSEPEFNSGVQMSEPCWNDAAFSCAASRENGENNYTVSCSPDGSCICSVHEAAAKSKPEFDTGIRMNEPSDHFSCSYSGANEPLVCIPVSVSSPDLCEPSLSNMLNAVSHGYPAYRRKEHESAGQILSADKVAFSDPVASLEKEDMFSESSSADIEVVYNRILSEGVEQNSIFGKKKLISEPKPSFQRC